MFKYTSAVVMTTCWRKKSWENGGFQINTMMCVLHHTAHALSGMLSYLDFRLDRRKTIHYTTSGLIFFKYLSRGKISVFKNIRIRVKETLVKIKSCWYEEIYHTLWPHVAERPYISSFTSCKQFSYRGSFQYSTFYRHIWNFLLDNVILNT